MNSAYLRTKKDSPTGVKLQACFDKLREAQKVGSEMVTKHAGPDTTWGVGNSPFHLFLGIYCVYLPEDADQTGWKKKRVGQGKEFAYIPDKRTQKGREIDADFKQVPAVRIEALYDAIPLKKNDDRYDYPRFGVQPVGDYFYVNIHPDQFHLPVDTEELTYTAYRKAITGESTLKVCKP